jgi:hypothetical protein
VYANPNWWIGIEMTLLISFIREIG